MLKKVFFIAVLILICVDILLQFFDLQAYFLFVKNLIPASLMLILVVEREFKLTRNDFFVLISFVFLWLGLDFSYFLHTKPYYLFVLTIIYFIEIQIQIFVVIDMLRNNTKYLNKSFLKTFMIFSLSLIFILIFFPFFDFPIQILFFIRIFQYIHYMTLVYKNKRTSPQISQSLWLLILSNIILLFDLVILDFSFDYPLIIVLFYLSKLFFLNGYLKTKSSFRVF